MKIIIFIYSQLLLTDVFAKNIVLVQSYPDGVWTQGIVNGVTETIRKYSTNFKITNLYYNSEYFRHVAKELQDKEVLKIVDEIKKVNPDYVILNDDEAVEKFVNLLNSRYQVIINGINDIPEKINGLSQEIINNLCGVIEDYPIEQSLKMISLMSEKIKQMSVISSENQSSKIVVRKFQKLSNEKIKLRKIYLSSSWDEWKRSLNEINMRDDLAWILVPYEIKNKSNDYVSLVEIAKWVRDNVKIPILGILSIHTKMGFLSAISIEPYGLGRQAAEIVIRIEQSSTCKKIGFEKFKYLNFEINKSEVSRLGLKVPSEFIGIAKFLEDKDIVLRAR